MRIDIPDFDAVKTGFEPLPAERLTFSITKGEDKISAKSGGKYISWELTCQSPGYEGRVIFDNTSLKETALFAVKALVDAAGAEQDESGFDTEEVVGCSVDAQLAIRSYCKACDSDMKGDVEKCPECELETRRSNDVVAYFPASN